MYKQYKAETRRLMGMMTDAIYTHKDIFLREIISNASDALDKLCFIALTNPIEGYDRSQPEIRIRFDKANRLLIVEDNGIGMNEEDLENNLGVIARSGSLDFSAENGGEKSDLPGLIGQFGVGFYSAFMAADRVVVRTRKYDSPRGYEWSSDGLEGYEIVPCDVPETGTSVIMHIREDAKNSGGDTEDGKGKDADKKSDDKNYDRETDDPDRDEYSRYLREYPVYKIIKQYSDYIRWPIRMYMPHPELKPGCDPQNPEYIEKFEYETVNSMCPIWKRKKSEVKESEYNDFYKEHFKDKTDPIRTIAVSVDGNVSYDALMFIPSERLSDYGSEDYKSGLELYSNGVRIMDHCETLLPDYYNFVRGVVETSDISLNISREMLQQDRQLRMISQSIEKKIKGELSRMLTEERDKYEKFFAQFGRHLKACAMEDFGVNQEKLQDLLLFVSSKENKPVTLKEYTDRMKPDQKYIFYATADTLDNAVSLPQTEVLRDKGYEILYFLDKVDELTARMFGNYHDIEFKSAVNGDFDESTGNNPAAEAEDAKVLEFIKNVLAGRLDEVKLSQRLKNHPVILTSGDGITFEMEQYFRSMKPDAPIKAKKILEINGEHEIFDKLKKAVNEDPEKAAKYAEVLYQQGRLMAGLRVENPTAYTDLICSLI